MKITAKISFFDYKLFFNTLFIIGIGLLALYSVSYNYTGFNNFKRQILFVTIALIIFGFVSKINYGAWENYASGIYLGGLLLMVLVLLIGREKHGTYGWLGYSSYHLQPVEVMKIGVILILAKYFSKIRMDDKRLRHLLISGVYCLIPIILTLKQPDFGSAAVIGGIWISLILIWGVKKQYLIYLLGFFFISALGAWFFLLKPYQKSRINTFLNPESDPVGSGYHVIQSMTAIGSGGIYGKGLGYGSQSQLHFLPEAHTDFIYAVIGEELGLIGIVILMLAFTLFFRGIYIIAQKSADNFGRFIAAGVMVMFFIQLMINIGMNIGLMPITGLPLPLVSYGGSAIMVELILLGIVFSIKSVSKKSEGYR